MNFLQFSTFLSELEKTALRNQMTEILSRLFSRATSVEIGPMNYVLQGRVAPLFEPLEFGMADKMVMRAISQGLDTELSRVEEVFKKEGDLGVATEKLKHEIEKRGHVYRPMSFIGVYTALHTLAVAGGEGSQDEKIQLLATLIRDLDPLSSRYVVRIPLAKLRLGFSDMTVLDSLSWMLTQSKSLRPNIEKAYNVRPDLGYIATVLKEKGIDGVEHVIPTVGTPILMARAERLSSTIEIIEKIGTCAVEPKIDGFRLQVHYQKAHGGKKELVRLFSRNLEDVTFMYPDVSEGVRNQVHADSVIFEGEAVGYHPHTGEFLPFQEIVQRKRKYDIESKAKEVPLKLIAFDVLQINGKSLLEKTYSERRKILQSLIHSGDRVLVAEEKVIDSSQELQLYFDDCISRGLEGIMAKKLDGIYTAGARGWSWIKLKRSYEGKLVDTIDAVVMGYDFGQGKRTGFGMGDFLIGIYDKTKDSFETIAKIGTGLTDEEWKNLVSRIQDDHLKVDTIPKNYDVDKMMHTDVWVKPSIVVEIRADEITRSPVHTAGRVLRPSKNGTAYEVKTPGYALRFPRLERFRDDKKPVDATTISEIEEIFGLQYNKK